MNLNDYYQRSLTEAKTTSIKGHILESNDKYIVVTWCNCVHHDPPNHPCPCMEDTKLIIDKSDIIGDIVTIDSQEKDKLSEFKLKIDANIIKEEKTVVKASNLAGFIRPPLGPLIAVICKLYPELCKKKDENSIMMAMSRLSNNDIIGLPDPFKDLICKLFPQICKGKGDGLDHEEPGVLYFLPVFLAGVVAGMIIDKVIDNVTD